MYSRRPIDVFVQIYTVLERYDHILCSVQNERGRVYLGQCVAAHITVVLVENFPERVYPPGPSVRHVLLAVRFELRNSPPFGPAMDVARRLVDLEVFGRDVSGAGPHNQLVDPICGPGRCDHRALPAVAPAQYRIPVDTQRLWQNRRKQRSLFVLPLFTMAVGVSGA